MVGCGKEWGIFLWAFVFPHLDFVSPYLDFQIRPYWDGSLNLRLLCVCVCVCVFSVTGHRISNQCEDDILYIPTQIREVWFRSGLCNQVIKTEL